MNPCELVTTITALACAISKCVPKEDLPILTSALGQLASTLATIAVQTEILSSDTQPEIPPTTVPSGETVIIQP